MTRPSDLTFANHVGIQTDDLESQDMPDVPAELRQTIGSHLWLTSLEVSAAITPTMLLPSFPRHPHADGPTPMTMEQLLDAQLKLEQAHQQRHISKMLKGVATSMHCLAKFSREAGLTSHMGHAQCLYACYDNLKVRYRPGAHHQIAIWISVVLPGRFG